MAEYAYLSDGLLEVYPDDGDLRVPASLHKRYVDAKAKLAAVEAELRARAERPLVVMAEQEPAMRAATRPGTWIVVRGGGTVADSPAQGTATTVQQEVEPDTPAPPPPTPAGPPKRPALGPCSARSNLPHLPARYALTDTSSVYFPGRKRVDGICQCGLRIADVKCPHQKQVLISKIPCCAWCGHQLVSRAGFVENKADMNGGVDPSIPTLIPIGAAGDDPVVKTAFRVESE